MSVPPAIVPFSLKDAPAIIEKLLPVQKLSAEAYKEQMAVHGKTLTALGSYWKGRKPLILAKACVLGCLLPATEDLQRDLEIFEKLMGMDDESFVIRLGRPRIAHILATLNIPDIRAFFEIDPEDALPRSAPFDLSNYGKVKVKWRADLSESERRRVEVQAIEMRPYREMVRDARRPEEVMDAVHDHIWEDVNAHLGTAARSFPELVEQLGIMRFGHRPRVADTFCGSGQIPFEAARLGCDVYASDLNPVACMLTWGAFNIVGGSPERRAALASEQRALVKKVQAEIDRLGVETDDDGWRGKVYLYCLEARCPQSEWMVPLLPTLVVSKGYRVIAELVPDARCRRYDIAIRAGATDEELKLAEQGTVRSDGRGQDPYMIHKVGGVEYRNKISTLRGDYRKDDGSTGNRLRLWELRDFKSRPEDIYQERLFAVQWMRPKQRGRGLEYEFRSVTEADLERERVVEEYISANLDDWQKRGWVPDMRIEGGYNTRQPIWERGWTHWHHMFNPRQLLIGGLVNQFSEASLKLGLTQELNVNSRLSRWNHSGGGGGIVAGVFDNQALNTLFNYGCRSLGYAHSALVETYKEYPLPRSVAFTIACHSADQMASNIDVYVTDPPYGDSVKYEEILEFFIAWLRRNPPPEFSDWVWDSRRSYAITGDDENFRRGMVAAYRRMAELMPASGIQVIMFTHQSGEIWADMANIVWASGLQVTAAWYVATETMKRIQEDASYVKGTVLLIVRQRQGNLKATRDDLAWVIQDEVEAQVQSLTGLNQQAQGLYRDENLFEDADLQMAGYAAALRVLTQHSTIDGKDMAAEALRPRVKGQTTFVDDLIDFAVSVANQSLVPMGITQALWDALMPAERFYLKLIDLEARGQKTLDNYQNFAKAFKVGDFRPLMASERANAARLKSAVEFGRSEMSAGSPFYNAALRAVLYALMELVNGVDGHEVLAHLALNIPRYYEQVQRDRIVELSDYLANKLEALRPEEAAAARVLRELVRNQRL